MSRFKRQAIVVSVLLLSCAEVRLERGEEQNPSSDSTKDSDSDSGTSSDGPSDTGSGEDTGSAEDTGSGTAQETDSETSSQPDVDTESDETGTDTDRDSDTVSDLDSETDTDPCAQELSIYWRDFEQNDGGYLTTPSNGIWIWGQVSGKIPDNGHGKVWATGLDEGWYGNCDNDFLTSPEQNLSHCGGKSLTLSFDIYYHYHYLSGDVYNDGLLVELFDSSSSTWIQVAPNEGSWDTNSIDADNCGIVPYIHGKPAFAGKSGAWTRKSFTVSFGSYSAFKFRFVHGSDDGYPVYGAYIDNVQVTAE